jgi:predicted Zn-dependent protease
MHAPASDLDCDRLLEVARTLAARARAASVDFAQVFAEESDGLRVETINGVRTGVVALPRIGVGCTIRVGKVWRHRYAPLDGVEDLVAWMRAAVGRDDGLAPVEVTGTVGPPRRWDARSVEDFVVPARRWWPDVDEERRPSMTIRCTEDVTFRRFAVMDTDGRSTMQVQPLVRRRVEAVVLGADGPSRSWAREVSVPGAAEDPAALQRLIRVAVTSAERMLSARATGERCTPVVFGPAAGAAFVHELIGHSLEDDNAVLAGGYAGRLRDGPVGPSCLTVADEPDRDAGYGSIRVDDEGIPATGATLLDAGTVRSTLTTVRSAARSAAALSGNGRREDYRFPTLPRATNTVVRPGRADPAALLEPGDGEVLYLRSMASGEVEPTTGRFRFAAMDGVLLTRSGEPAPVRDVILAGDALSALMRLEAVGNDLGGDNVTCGKQGQSVGIGLFSPTMRFADLTWRAT